MPQTHDGYELVIGLEVHVKLNSTTKMFCACRNVQNFDDLPANTLICPVCTGQPGALPVVQEEPLRKAVQLWLALWCNIQPDAYFERKSYFYPDLPMWFQITQFMHPTSIDGMVNCRDNTFEHTIHIGIRDAHIEHDTGKVIHHDGQVMIDYNRAGTPLVEIVTEPDFRSDDEVIDFLKELQRIIRYQGIGDADLEKGQMRCDVNISLRPVGTQPYGTRTEMKNLNSFGAIKKAIEHEMKRQADVLRAGGEVDQETRGWDDAAWVSFVMRSKADALDYRYFPEPDIPPMQLTEEWIAARRAELQELPFEKVKRYKTTYGFNKEYIHSLLQDVTLNQWFEALLHQGHDPQLVAKRFAWPLAKYLNQHQVSIAETKLHADRLSDFFTGLTQKTLAEAHAKKVFAEMLATWATVEEIVQLHGLQVATDEELKRIVDQVISQHPQALQDIEAGKMQAVGFLVGQCMQAAAGKGDPKRFKDILIWYAS